MHFNHAVRRNYGNFLVCLVIIFEVSRSKITKPTNHEEF